MPFAVLVCIELPFLAIMGTIMLFLLLVSLSVASLSVEFLTVRLGLVSPHQAPLQARPTKEKHKTVKTVKSQSNNRFDFALFSLFAQS
jgi:hypothetical protein